MTAELSASVRDRLGRLYLNRDALRLDVGPRSTVVLSVVQGRQSIRGRLVRSALRHLDSPDWPRPANTTGMAFPHPKRYTWGIRSPNSTPPTTLRRHSGGGVSPRDSSRLLPVCSTPCRACSIKRLEHGGAPHSRRIPTWSRTLPPSLFPTNRTDCGARRRGHLAIANPAATGQPCFRNRPGRFTPACQRRTQKGKLR